MADKEYIDREAALDCFACDLGKKDYSVSYQGFMTEAAFRINDLPTADVRPVVRCGECKHWFENGTDYCSCDRDALLRERDFFCAAGEKREES